MVRLLIRYVIIFFAIGRTLELTAFAAVWRLRVSHGSWGDGHPGLFGGKLKGPLKSVFNVYHGCPDLSRMPAAFSFACFISEVKLGYSVVLPPPILLCFRFRLRCL